MEGVSGVAKAKRLYTWRSRLQGEELGWGCREQVEVKSPVRGHDERLSHSGPTRPEALTVI